MNPLWVARIRAAVAVLISVQMLYYIWEIDRSGRLENPWTGGVLAIVVATFAAAGLAIVIGGYTLFLTVLERARIWSWVAVVLMFLAVVGFETGWFLGLAVDA